MKNYLIGMTNAEMQLYDYCRKFENENFKVVPNLMIERSGGREEVRNLLGSPSKIDIRFPDNWYYGISSITFDGNGKVKAWVNNGQLTEYLDN